MNTEGLTFLIDWKKGIVFRSEYARIEERDGALYCSLKGEFFEKEQPYTPKMEYVMGDVGVTTRDFAQVLNPIYHYLTLERKVLQWKKK